MIMCFGGARVLSFESRRASEMGELIRINGGDPFVAPALVEAPLERNQQVFDFADRLYAGDFEMLILLTGVGTRLMAEVLATRDPQDRFVDALRKVTIVARGPKPAAVLREWKVPVSVSVPEPNTWREVLEAVARRSEKRVAVQEYGRSNPALIDGLKEQGREVTCIPVYQWQLPEDTGPLSQALDGLSKGEFEVALFTTGVQIDHFAEFADRAGKQVPALDTLKRMFVASIGPDTTEALRSHGIEPSFAPSHPKMGILVREAAMAFQQARKDAAEVQRLAR
ncbi:MAG: uroporphyrinogen-III synthase [Acidobacteriaceae bacterium]|nr:uroporphyrinogen-III synthase [Acidobacteriaceae bacterium]